MHPVEAQVEAYNARDLGGFLACYSPDVVFHDGAGDVVFRGIDNMRAEFSKLFSGSPALHADILSRVDVGAYVILEERIEGYGGAPIRGVMVYHVEGDQIDRATWIT